MSIGGKGIKKQYLQARISGILADATPRTLTLNLESQYGLSPDDSIFTLYSGKTYQYTVRLGASNFSPSDSFVKFGITTETETVFLNYNEGVIFDGPNTFAESAAPSITGIIIPNSDTRYRVYAKVVSGGMALHSLRSSLTIIEL